MRGVEVERAAGVDEVQLPGVLGDPGHVGEDERIVLAAPSEQVDQLTELPAALDPERQGGAVAEDERGWAPACAGADVDRGELEAPGGAGMEPCDDGVLENRCSSSAAACSIASSAPRSSPSTSSRPSTRRRRQRRGRRARPSHPPWWRRPLSMITSTRRANTTPPPRATASDTWLACTAVTVRGHGLRAKAAAPRRASAPGSCGADERRFERARRTRGRPGETTGVWTRSRRRVVTKPHGIWSACALSPRQQSGAHRIGGGVPVPYLRDSWRAGDPRTARPTQVHRHPLSAAGGSRPFAC